MRTRDPTPEQQPTDEIMNVTFCGRARGQGLVEGRVDICAQPVRTSPTYGEGGRGADR